jgi:PEP-CTERM motif-containing protein
MKPNSSLETVAPLRNDRNIWLAVASILAAGLVTADAQLYSYDGINYAPGDFYGGDNGPTPFFAGNWDSAAAWGGGAGTVLQVQGTGATYPGLATSGGSVAAGTQTFSDGWGGANSVANRASRQFTTPWNSGTDGTYFVSFLMSFGGDTVGHVGYRAFEMWSGSVNDSPGRALQMGYASYGDFGAGGLTSMNLRITPNGPATPGEPLAVNTLIPVGGTGAFGADGGATHLFVFRFDMSSVPGLDVIQLYVDPSDLSSEAGNSPNAVFVGDFAASHISSVSQFAIPAIADGSAGGPHDVAPQPANISIFDELRIGGDWNSVLPVPEPTSFTLLALGGLGLAMRRFRKKD